ncbi:MAG: helicase-related protein [Candidatus Omnitrophota bacterium]|jgi:hypothetical protein
MKITKLDDAINFIANSKAINFNDSFELSKAVAFLLSEEESAQQGREIIIRILDAWSKVNSETKNIWNDLIEASGLYPYVEQNKLSGSSCLRQEYHKSKYLVDKYFHAEQMNISILLHKLESLIVSAPTSFGKSLLIEEVVASKVHNNIVVIQPTLALLDETRKKLQQYSDDYNIIVSTSQMPSPRKNLFLFTGERVVEYKHFPKIDFFVLDEFYKLSPSRDDDRSIALNHALYLLLKMTKRFYMLGPSIKSIPEGFASKYNANWLRTSFATVAIDINKIYEEKKINKETQETALFDLLLTLKEPTLIYCSSPGKVNKLIPKFLEFMLNKNHNGKQLGSSNHDLTQWIDTNIHENWDLRKALANRIGFHHGALPRHLASSVVDAFNSGDIHYLFCTSTLIEGVNTSAKNVVLFDKKKGLKQIDYFDFKNITGRAGRMSRHFIGNIFQFHPEPQQLELNIDIPLYNQTSAPLELLIQMDPKDRVTSTKEKLKDFDKMDVKLREVLIKNTGMPLEGQLKIIQTIEQNLSNYHPLLNWSKIPNYQQLNTVIELGWKNLLKKNESKGGLYVPSQLAVMALQYYGLKSLNGIIKESMKSKYWINKEPDEHERLQQIVEVVLQCSRHWFDYKLPKMLVVMSELQAYVFKRNGLNAGEYAFFASQIENEFIQSNLTILLEYDVPMSAVRKLSKYIKEGIKQEEIIRKVHSLDLNTVGLLPYEIKKLKMLPKS